MHTAVVIPCRKVTRHVLWVFGLLFVLFGTVFGAWQWTHSVLTSHPASSGAVIVAALPLIVGIQFLIAFLRYGVTAVPADPLWPAQPDGGAA